MNSASRLKARGSRLTVLASSMAACWPLLASSALAATHNVTNCLDTGSGSLRAVVGAATTHSGDTINMTGLTCATITLETGITVAQNSLTINGPGKDKLSIIRDPSGIKHRIFRHTGTGTLSLSGMTISGGFIDDSNTPAHRGGCIDAYNLDLDQVIVEGCTATGASYANGGGIYAVYLTMHNSTISGNTTSFTDGVATHKARGGGAFVVAAVSIHTSALKNNSVTGGPLANGGGLFASYTAGLFDSTISGNHADGTGGGVYIQTTLYLGPPPRLTVVDSTISDNDASIAGGIYSTGSIKLSNTTIVDNATASASPISFGDPTLDGSGIALVAKMHSLTIELQSSLLANNTFSDSAYDVDLSAHPVSTYTISASGANNLVRSFVGVTLPGVIQSCPLLGPLRDNGGATKTHALLSHSPGIDVGNNAAGLSFDQRGTPFERVYGLGVDIGSYEIQPETIFDNGFDGCAAIPR